MSKSLIEQLSDMQQLEADLAINGGEITPDLQCRMNDISRGLSDKVDSCYQWVIESEAMVEQYKASAKPYLEAAKSLKNKVNRFKTNYLKTCISLSGDEKITGQMWELKLRKASKVVDIFSETVIPDMFKTEETIVKIDKTKLLRELKTGREIAGANLTDGVRNVYFGGAK